MLDQIRKLLSGMATDPSGTLASLSIESAVESAVLIDSFNQSLEVL